MENKYRDLSDLPLILRVEDLMPILGIGRNTAYELIRSGQIRSIRIGRQIRIPRDALLEFLRKKMLSPLKVFLTISAAHAILNRMNGYSA